MAPFSCETMRESIVPDSCADIARIVDTTALVYLTGRELTGDGRICASGTVDVSVLELLLPHGGDDPEQFRPSVRVDGDGFVQPYGDTPLDDEYLGENVYLNIINQARDYVYFMTPYLIIDTEIQTRRPR